MTRRTLLSFVVLAAATTPALGQGKGKRKGSGQGNQRSGINASINIFLGNDRRVIGDWISSRPMGSLPPGLANRESLPPGLQKQLAKNGQLPRGLEKRMTSFPAELNNRLSPLQSGLGRIFIHGRAVIFNRETRVILDVFLP